jgi:hypothetical protein
VQEQNVPIQVQTATLHGFSRRLWDMQSIRQAKRTAGGVSEFGRSISGCPGGGREFGDSTDWKIAQSRQDGTQIVADRDFEPPTGFDH